jgi:K(+)-stimulated pyrophosphate-energized sodium pump
MLFSNALLLITSLISTIVGATLLYTTVKSSTKNKANELTKVLKDGLEAVTHRLVSGVAQILIYTAVVFGLFSWIFNKAFSLPQVIAFFIGGLLMIILLLSSTLLTPQSVPNTIEKSKGYLQPGLLTQANTVFGLGLFNMGLFMLGFLSCVLFLGTPTIIGFGLGISLASFFLRISTGLFKTAANISADSVSQIKKTVPHFDKRNPATLLDIIGDYIGNIVGFNSDIISSFIFTLIACILFPKALVYKGLISQTDATTLIAIPIIVMAISLIASLIAYGYTLIRYKIKTSNILLEGLYISLIICLASTFWVLSDLKLTINALPFLENAQRFSPFYTYMFGLIGAVFLSFTSEYLTSTRFKPTKKIAREAENGSVISVFNSLSLGLRSNAVYLIYLLIIMVPAFYFAGIYGIGMASLGMLSATSSIVIIHTFKPLSNATHKINQLTRTDDNSIKNTKKMQRIGNTTIALGSGFAAGAAVLSTLSIFAAILVFNKDNFDTIFIINIKSFLSIVLGMMLPTVFSGVLLKRLSQLVVKTNNEVIRQFKEIPYLFEDKAKPDMTKISDENAKFSSDSLIIPGIIMAIPPILIGYTFGLTLLLGYVLGALLTGINQNYYWANAGDTAGSVRNYIQSGHYGGTDSPNYPHTLVADNIGDAYKDLLSPSINIFIKSTTIIAALILFLLTSL